MVFALKGTKRIQWYFHSKSPKTYCQAIVFFSEGCAKLCHATITIMSQLMENALDTLSEYPPLLQVPACCCFPEALVSRVTCEVPFLHLYASFPLSSSLVVMEAEACLLR